VASGLLPLYSLQPSEGNVAVYLPEPSMGPLGLELAFHVCDPRAADSCRGCRDEPEARQRRLFTPWPTGDTSGGDEETDTDG
jgi:hypothetical protein